MTTPSARLFMDLKSFILRDKPLVGKEKNFLKREDDLVALEEGQDRGWLDEMIEARMEWDLPEKVFDIEPLDYLCFSAFTN